MSYGIIVSGANGIIGWGAMSMCHSLHYKTNFEFYGYDPVNLRREAGDRRVPYL
jgi:hypothetical protein